MDGFFDCSLITSDSYRSLHWSGLQIALTHLMGPLLSKTLFIQRRLKELHAEVKRYSQLSACTSSAPLSLWAAGGTGDNKFGVLSLSVCAQSQRSSEWSWFLVKVVYQEAFSQINFSYVLKDPEGFWLTASPESLLRVTEATRMFPHRIKFLRPDNTQLFPWVAMVTT